MDDLGTTFTMSSFEVFCEPLTWKHIKLSQLYSIYGSKSQALVAQTLTSIGKQKKKQKNRGTQSTPPTSKSHAHD